MIEERRAKAQELVVARCYYIKVTETGTEPSYLKWKAPLKETQLELLKLCAAKAEDEFHHLVEICYPVDARWAQVSYGSKSKPTVWMAKILPPCVQMYLEGDQVVLFIEEGEPSARINLVDLSIEEMPNFVCLGSKLQRVMKRCAEKIRSQIEE